MLTRDDAHPLVRSTNVYEERSLGLFEEADDSDSDDGEAGAAQPGPGRGSKMLGYLAFHARKQVRSFLTTTSCSELTRLGVQLAFDIWWLALALWLCCIIEREEINNPATESWLNIFNILFEIVSLLLPLRNGVCR